MWPTETMRDKWFLLFQATKFCADLLCSIRVLMACDRNIGTFREKKITWSIEKNRDIGREFFQTDECHLPLSSTGSNSSMNFK